MNRKREEAIEPEIMENLNRKPNTENSATIVGFLRGAIIFFTTIAFSLGIVILMGIRTGMEKGFWAGAIDGILAGGLFFIVGLVIAIYMANTAKKMTVTDCVLPIIISIISAVVFFPVSFLFAEFFSWLTCIGAGFFLSWAMFMYKNKEVGGWTLVIPFIVFVYEILPVSLPTDIDNFIALGGSGTNVVLRYMMRKTVQGMISEKN